jgi:hypothetical protein
MRPENDLGPSGLGNLPGEIDDDEIDIDDGVWDLDGQPVWFIPGLPSIVQIGSGHNSLVEV